MEYKTTVKNHFKALELFIIVTIGIIGFALYQIHQNNYDEHLKNGLLVFALINFLPVLYLHIEYYSFNNRTKLEINIYNKQISYTKSGRTEMLNFDELSKIVVYMAPFMHSKRLFIRIPFDQYHYARIYTKSGRTLIVTCLMAQKVQDAIGNIRGVAIEKKKRLFASILLEDLWN